MTDSLKPLEFKTDQERLVAALAVAVLGLDIIARANSSRRCRTDARCVLDHLRARYGVTPQDP